MLKRVVGGMLVWVPAAVVTAIVLVIAAWIVSGMVPGVGKPSAGAVAESVADTVGGVVSVSSGCRALRRGSAWRCWIADRSRSSTALYRVVIDGRRCWTARRLSRYRDGDGTIFRRVVEGCVSLRDQL